LDSNGVTIKYTGNAADVPTSSALFIQADPRGTGLEWFAVVKDDMKSSINTYSRGGTNAPFIPSGQVPVPFNNIVTTLITGMGGMFYAAAAFNQPIGSWDTSNVVDMYITFFFATAFNQPIGSWNTAKVSNMSIMFTNTNFNQPIGSWNTATVIDMSYMFYNTPFNQNISGWNVGLVTNYSNFGNSALIPANYPPFS
jgi:surface protein